MRDQHGLIAHQVFFAAAPRWHPAAMRVRRSSPYFSHELLQVVLDHAQDLLGVGQQVFQVGDRVQRFPCARPRSSGARGPPAGAAACRGWPGPGAPLSLKRSIRRALAVSASGDSRMVLITASRLARAISSPSRMWARARALASSNCERRVITSWRCSMIDLQGALERKQARLAIHQRQHLHAEGGLQRGVLVQLVEHLAWLARRA